MCEDCEILKNRIKELEESIKHLIANRDDWVNACKEAWEFRDRTGDLLKYAKASLTHLLEAVERHREENHQLRLKLEELEMEFASFDAALYQVTKGITKHLEVEDTELLLDTYFCSDFEKR